VSDPPCQGGAVPLVSITELGSSARREMKAR
jgi:hypothetical protein